jgi:uncharacterized protein CbrC (UPF0167 family)
LSEKKDVYVEAKKQMRLSERIVAAIPGFHGYKEKELRRESDKLIRNHLHLRLSGLKDDLQKIFQKLSDRRYFDVLTDMDRLMAKADRITEKVNHTSYGYSGFFDVAKVKEENLDRMIDFDNKLVDETFGLAADVDVFKAEIAKGETKNVKEKVQNIADKMEEFEETFDKRTEVILGVT